MNYLTLIIVFFSLGVWAQESEITLTSDGFSSKIVQADSLSATQIYANAKLAISKLMSNPKYAIKADVPDQLLRFSGRTFLGTGLNEGNYFFTCQIEIKPGRYKISFSDVYFEKGISTSPSEIFNKAGELRKHSYYRAIYDNYLRLVNDIHALIKASVLTKQGSW